MRELDLFPVHQELEEPLSEQVYGGDATAQGIKAQIADSPIAFRIRDVLGAAKVEVPPQIDLYRRFEVWVVPIRIGVMRESGLAEVTSVGCEVEFDDRGRTLCVVEVLPGPAFMRHGTLAGELVCEGAFTASGAVAPVPEGSGALSLGGLDMPAATAVGLRLGVSSKAAMGISFSFVVVTPYVHAVGIGSKRVQWRLDRHDEPLFGRDLQLFAVIALPRNCRELGMRARVNLTARTAFFPTRRESTWANLSCLLHH